MPDKDRVEAMWSEHNPAWESVGVVMADKDAVEAMWSVCSFPCFAADLLVPYLMNFQTRVKNVRDMYNPSRV